jgi:CDP-diglyceride synthetase
MNIGIGQLNEWFKSHAAVDAYENSRQAQTSYYYQTNAENRAAIAHVLSWGYRYGELIWSLLLMSPLLIAVYYPWIRASHTAPTKLSAWRYRLVWILITIITIPVFCFAIDYSRWLVCFFFSMFASTIAVLTIRDKNLTAAVLRMNRYFKAHPIAIISLVIYMLGMHITPYSNQYGLKEGIDLWYFIKSIFYY